MKQPYHNSTPLSQQGRFDMMRKQKPIYRSATSFPVFPVYDHWYQVGSSNSWSTDSSSLSSESSTSFDSNETSPLSTTIYRREERNSWSPSPAPTSAPLNFHGYVAPPLSKRKFGSLPPQALPSWTPQQCVALDAEMVGVGQHGEDSSVARVVIVNWYGTVLFDEYIKQTQTVTDYRTFVSGITEDQLSYATLSLRNARKRILKILYGRFLIGHALKNDLQALGISHPWWLIRDTARYEPFMQNFGRDETLWPRKLKDLSLELLGTNIQIYGKPHSPYEDAVAALNLYKKVRIDWEKLMGKKVSKTNEIHAEERQFQRKIVKQQQEWAMQQQAAYIQMQQMMWHQHQQLASQYYPSPKGHH